MKAFLPRSQLPRGDEPPKAVKDFGKQTNCPLDNFKPYQRPKLSDPAHGTLRLQPERDGRVRCSAWLADVLIFLCLLLMCVEQSQQKHPLHVATPISDGEHNEPTGEHHNQECLRPEDSK
jgi:hypothetical protein